MAELVKKIDLLRGMCADGNYYGALRLAASWQRLGDHKAAITAGWAAASNPDFYRQMGKDPVALVATGVAALFTAYKPDGTVWPDFNPQDITKLCSPRT